MKNRKRNERILYQYMKMQCFTTTYNRYSFSCFDQLFDISGAL